jgi:hypothetical protein
MEIRQSNPETEKATTKIDINEIIGKVTDFVDIIKKMSPNGKPMAVNFDRFNFSVSKARWRIHFNF